MPSSVTRSGLLTRRQAVIARAVLAVLVAGLVAAFAALLLGEYPFSGATPWVAGVLLGFVVAEILVSIGRSRGLLFGALAAAFSAGALLWAGWISAGDGKQPFPAMAWVAAALAIVAAVLRAGPKPAKRSRARDARS